MAISGRLDWLKGAKEIFAFAFGCVAVRILIIEVMQTFSESLDQRSLSKKGFLPVLLPRLYFEI